MITFSAARGPSTYVLGIAEGDTRGRENKKAASTGLAASGLLRFAHNDECA
tara:strand:+ start:1282 stop:1434 length:153 start_codon:yes stop_codon:yes gene_type:complete